MTKNSVWKRLYRHGVQLMLVGILTGLCAGVVVTFYNLAADILSEHSKSIYLLVRENPAFVPLLFLTLIVCAFIIGVICRLVPMARGSGIPQTEGATRGLLNMKWYTALPSMAAASLLCIFSGLTAGSEGPSMFVGANCGDGVGRLLKCNDMERRYQLTGGACAGLAVAFNAPLTGIVFAFEEAHRRFTPAIFICAFSSVLSGIVTRNLLYKALGMAVTTTLTNFRLVQMPLEAYGYVLLAAVISGIVGVLFYIACIQLKKLFAKVTFLHGVGKMLFPFMIAGVFGLICTSVMGGGRSFINALGTQGGEGSIELVRIFSTPLALTLALILIMRFVATTVNVGAGVPCGVFIPMLAIGASIGALVSQLCGVMGMPATYADCIIMICMATFFASIVKAPITASIMVVELTGQFTLLIPVILGVSIGYMMSEVFGLKPFYERLLDDIMKENHVVLEKRTYNVVLEEGSIADGQSIRDILWPGNLLVRSIKRNENKIVPNSDTVLLAGDELTIQAECVDYQEFTKWVDEVVKKKKKKVVLLKNRRN